MKKLMNFLSSKTVKEKKFGLYVGLFLTLMLAMYFYYIFGPETSGTQFTYSEF